MRLENSFIQIPRIGDKTEQKLWKKGITHWDHVEDSSNLTDAKKDRIMTFVEKARKNLEVKNSYFFGERMPSKESWRLYKNFSENACFFDIETTGLDKQKNKVTTVGTYRGGESKVMVRGKDLTREKLKREIDQASVLVSFNGKMFDVPFLEQNFDMKIDKPHIDLRYPCKRLGLSGGLKQIEKDLMIERELEDVDGREAVRLWKRYENGDEQALEKLVRYNRYDAVNLEELLELVHKRLTTKFYHPYVG